MALISALVVLSSGQFMRNTRINQEQGLIRRQRNRSSLNRAKIQKDGFILFSIYRGSLVEEPTANPHEFVLGLLTKLRQSHRLHAQIEKLKRCNRRRHLKGRGAG